MVIIASFTTKQAMIFTEKYYLIKFNDASIYPAFPIYISNVSHLYIQYSEIREFSNTKVSNEIAFIKHEESHDYNIG